MKQMLQIVAMALVIVVAWACTSANPIADDLDLQRTDKSDIGRAFKNRTSDVQVEGEGTVTRILPDDVKGQRHQRFILRLASGRTVLIAHNIDLAPRVESLRRGDTVQFKGEYEWNAEGGVIHWTHHDPARRHAAGWLKHKERIYQ